MNNCANLYFLSTLACQLSRCLSEEELNLLAADLVVLSDMLSNLLTRQDICSEKEKEPDSRQSINSESDIIEETDANNQ